VVPEDKEPKVLKVQRVDKVHKGLQVHLDHKEHLVPQVKQELKVIQEERDQQVTKELKVQQEQELHVFQWDSMLVILVISRVTSVRT
jgi:hypothetical protein